RACWLLGIDGEGRGSGVEVVEWARKKERGGEWGWWENRLQVLQCLVFKRGRDEVLWHFCKIGPWEKKYALSLTKLPTALYIQDEIEGQINNLSSNKDGGNRFMGINEVFNFGDGTIMKVKEELKVILKENRLNYIHGCLKGHVWTTKDIRRSKRMLNEIKRIPKNNVR
nr:hypothetical protein [Tanacetum cinerariifolium]